MGALPSAALLLASDMRARIPPEMSNYYCHPGKAGGSPWTLGMVGSKFGAYSQSMDSGGHRMWKLVLFSRLMRTTTDGRKFKLGGRPSALRLTDGLGVTSRKESNP